MILDATRSFASYQRNLFSDCEHSCRPLSAPTRTYSLDFTCIHPRLYELKTAALPSTGSTDIRVDEYLKIKLRKARPLDRRSVVQRVHHKSVNVCRCGTHVCVILACSTCYRFFAHHLLMVRHCTTTSPETNNRQQASERTPSSVVHRHRHRHRHHQSSIGVYVSISTDVALVNMLCKYSSGRSSL